MHGGPAGAGAFRYVPTISSASETLNSARKRAGRVAPSAGIKNEAEKERNRAARQMDTLMKELSVPLTKYLKGFPDADALHPFEQVGGCEAAAPSAQPASASARRAGLLARRWPRCIGMEHGACGMGHGERELRLHHPALGAQAGIVDGALRDSVHVRAGRLAGFVPLDTDRTLVACAGATAADGWHPTLQVRDRQGGQPAQGSTGAPMRSSFTSKLQLCCLHTPCSL